MTVRLTRDELTAVARLLGAPGFPGVVGTRCGDIDDQCLTALIARGLLVRDGRRLWAAEPFDAILTVAIAHRRYVAVEQTRPGAVLVRAFLAGDEGIVRHRVIGSRHDLDLFYTGADPGSRLAAALDGIVGRSPGTTRHGRERRWGRRSRIGDMVARPAGGWRRSTALARTDQAGDGVLVEGFLGILDGGPDRLWLVWEDGDGPYGPADDSPVVAEPATAAEVDAAIEAFAA